MRVATGWIRIVRIRIRKTPISKGVNAHLLTGSAFCRPFLLSGETAGPRPLERLIACPLKLKMGTTAKFTPSVAVDSSNPFWGLQSETHSRGLQSGTTGLRGLHVDCRAGPAPALHLRRSCPAFA